MRKFISVLTMVVVSQLSFAHEGHDKTPGAMVAPHGGVIQGAGEIYLEFVNESGGVRIYPLTHDLAAIPLKEVTLQGSANFPKKAKPEPVVFAQSGDHFSAKVDAKGAYRYTLDITVSHKGKKAKAKFQVEPQN